DLSGSGRGGAPATAVRVDPAAFRGDLPCGDGVGAFQVYVATLLDASDQHPLFGPTDAAAFELPSSPPTPCRLPVSFERVAPLRAYRAEIRAWDRADLVPLAAGSPVLVDPQTGEAVPPRWETTCGAYPSSTPTDGGPRDAALADASSASTSDASALAVPPYVAGDCLRESPADGGVPPRSGPTCAIFGVTVPLVDCAPLRPVAGAADGGAPGAAISVTLSGRAFERACSGDAGGQLVVKLEGHPAREAACGERVLFEGLRDGQAYRLRVTTTPVDAGANDGGSPALATDCFARAARGAVVPADCDPLRPEASATPG
ncbi:MAG: hypothetical protein FJ104_16000, partial [Deltaproteobacteria bacterium]|nr:hypothetical protein [Deltaproteobacteria bacterium]